MKKLKNFHRSTNIGAAVISEFPISSRMPLPMRKVDYKELLRLMKVLEGLPVGSSFPIKKELDYAVRKLGKDYYPEYKITVRNTGENLNRVFRVA